jgi:chromosome segregation ATPase
MSLIGTAIGALVALLPPALLQPKREKPPVESEVERLRGVVDGLNRSHARLLDHIETLEREILIEQHLCAHWKEEAERLAKHAVASRQRAEALERDRQDVQYQAQMNGRNALAYAQMQQAQQNLASHLQQNHANQQQLAAFAPQVQGLQGAAQGFCNCVPSRAQVWGQRRWPERDSGAIGDCIEQLNQSEE